MSSTALPTVFCQVLTPKMHALANTFYRQHGSAMKARDVHQVWAARLPDGGTSDAADVPGIVACLCLQPVKDDAGHWLTSLFVDPCFRNLGLASFLLSHLRQARDGSIWLFCRPELAELYQRHGYQIASRLPESLASKLKRYQRNKDMIALVSTPE